MRIQDLFLKLGSWREAISIWWGEEFLTSLGIYDDPYAITTVATRHTTVGTRHTAGPLRIFVRVRFSSRRKPWVTVFHKGIPPEKGVDILLTDPLRIKRRFRRNHLDEHLFEEAMRFVKLNRELMLDFWHAQGEIDSLQLLNRLNYVSERDTT